MVSSPLLVCRGIAKNFGLRISGRRNSFGGMIGKRSRPWQSGTCPAFAVLIRSNTHTLFNFRAPVLSETHEDAHCDSPACRAKMLESKDKKNMAKMAQRACRECTGYHSGYTFKGQPVGMKYLHAAAETLNYVNDSMEQKSENQKWHYITHRILQDLNHRCMARPATEETNLAAYWHPHDVTNAEFIRTYMNETFAGGILVQRLEAERSRDEDRVLTKVLPKMDSAVPSEELFLKCFDDIYGFRAKNTGFGKHIFYLNPWEFIMLWEVKALPKPRRKEEEAEMESDDNDEQNQRPTKAKPLSVFIGDDGDYGPNMEAECDDILFFPSGIPGPSNLHQRWYMRRRRRPMVPQPTRTPMPEKEKDPEKKARLFSLYMRPWTLQESWATQSVPHICRLDCRQYAASRSSTVEPGGPQIWPDVPMRSYELSWRDYIRGHVVSRHAQRLIVQFMAANCGKSTSPDNAAADDDQDLSKMMLVPDNNVPLERVHAIIDNMSSEKTPGEPAASHKKKQPSQQKMDFPEDFNEDEEESRDPEASTLVKEALVTTGKLWCRKHWSQDAEPDMDVRHSMLSTSTMTSIQKKAQHATKEKGKRKSPRKKKKRPVLLHSGR